MKVLGMAFIAIGIALFLFILYSVFQEKKRVVSPIPEDKGVKVILATPPSK